MSGINIGWGLVHCLECIISGVYLRNVDAIRRCPYRGAAVSSRLKDELSRATLPPSPADPMFLCCLKE